MSHYIPFMFAYKLPKNEILHLICKTLKLWKRKTGFCVCQTSVVEAKPKKKNQFSVIHFNVKQSSSNEAGQSST